MSEPKMSLMEKKRLISGRQCAHCGLLMDGFDNTCLKLIARSSFAGDGYDYMWRTGICSRCYSGSIIAEVL